MGRRFWGVAALLIAGGCGDDLSSGTYSFRQVSEIRSSCAIDPPIPTAWDGNVTVRGLSLTIELPEQGFRFAVGERSLFGIFQPDRREEPRFLTDSTFDDFASIEGVECFVFTHLQIGATVTDDGFRGIARIVDSRQLEADRACPFACVQEIEFVAKKR
ncbi:MAG TPA: hypothetical protein VGD74_00220 [Vulgatibacter sp.]